MLLHREFSFLFSSADTQNAKFIFEFDELSLKHTEIESRVSELLLIPRIRL